MLNLSAGSSSYDIQRSLRFRSSASAYLSRTPSVAGNTKTWTWSGWVKRGELKNRSGLFSAGASGAVLTETVLQIDEFDSLCFYSESYSGSWVFTTNVRTSALLRDPSSWYHIICSVDTTQSLNSDRIKLYINGNQITALSTIVYPSQNTDLYVNSSKVHLIGANWNSGMIAPGTEYFDGYLTEVNFIDGQSLTPASFGQTNPATGQWVPKKYTGTYGTNGFYLPFTNNSSTTTLGYDFSGNGNNWTCNNISLTSGATYDSVTDVPTLTSATAANYAVLNPLVSSNPTGFTGSTALLSNGNLTVTGQSAAAYYASSTIAYPVTGKWYMEVTTASVAEPFKPHTFGIGPYGYTGSSTSLSIYLNNYGQANNQNNLYRNTGSYINIQTTGILYTQAANDIIQFAYDADSGKIWLGINNNWIGTTGTVYNGDPATGTNPTDVFVVNSEKVFWNSPYGSGTQSHVNFGQRPFAYTPPTGFKSLNTFNLPTPAIQKGNKFMDATLYTGNGSTQSVVNSGGFQPDLVWIKSRNVSGSNHVLTDSVRGATKFILSNLTDAEYTVANTLTSFNSNGFSLGNTAYDFNIIGNNYVGWQWKGGGTAVTNNTGSITSQVSANASAGFSIVTYTGNGSAGATVGHGLGVAPKMIIVKCRGTGINSWTSWQVYHTNLSNPQTSFVRLNELSAVYSGYSAAWNSTNPTSSVFSISYNAGAGVNGLGDTFVAYCFAEIPGYSKFGSYTGNGSIDGPFVYCGFRPKYVLIKNTTSVGSYDWEVYDTSRDAYNAAGNRLFPDLSGAESPFASLDILSNGFKLRQGSGGDLNTTDATHIYAAFAESPFKYSNAR